MALSVTLPTSEMETESFNSFNSFGHIISMSGLSQTSPSPSVSSESSGIGSLKGDSVAGDSLPASPHTTDKKLFEPVAAQAQPPSNENAKKVDDVKIMYEGRNLLNLYDNIHGFWYCRASYLPPNNASLFFANRSQYHRLSGFSTTTKYETEKCDYCDFNYVVAAKD